MQARVVSGRGTDSGARNNYQQDMEVEVEEMEARGRNNNYGSAPILETQTSVLAGDTQTGTQDLNNIRLSQEPRKQTRRKTEGNEKNG